MEERNFDTLKLFQMFFAILLMFLIIGIREYKKTKNLMWGIFYLCTSLFILFVGVKAL